jgi:hypothetical protein
MIFKVPIYKVSICKFYCFYVLLELTVYKVSKFIVFTNLWKNFVYLFAKSELVIGQFLPAFVILFLRTCLCFLNNSHSHSIWSVVCRLVLQGHVGSSTILNLWKYYLSLLCPVTNVDKFTHNCSLFDILSFTLGKNVFVNIPLFEESYSLCHAYTPFFFLTGWSLHSSKFWCRRSRRPPPFFYLFVYNHLQAIHTSETVTPQDIEVVQSSINK